VAPRVVVSHFGNNQLPTAHAAPPRLLSGPDITPARPSDDGQPQPLNGGSGRKGGAPFRKAGTAVLADHRDVALVQNDRRAIGRHRQAEHVRENRGSVGVPHGGHEIRREHGPRLAERDLLKLGGRRKCGQHVRGEGVEEVHPQLPLALLISPTSVWNHQTL